MELTDATDTGETTDTIDTTDTLDVKYTRESKDTINTDRGVQEVTEGTKVSWKMVKMPSHELHVFMKNYRRPRKGSDTPRSSQWTGCVAQTVQRPIATCGRQT